MRFNFSLPIRRFGRVTPAGWVACAAAIWAVAMLVRQSDGGEAEAEPMATIAGKVDSFLKKHCADCHLGSDPNSGVSLEELFGGDSGKFGFADKYDAWFDVAEKLKSGEMPPDDQPRPDADTLRSTIEWIEAELARVEKDRPVDPGRVTIRRLNRVEYKNTIRDLLGIEFEPADDFPADEVGYGFDNIGDVLSISPLHLEKYLDAAEAIAKIAVASPETATGPRKKFTPERIRGGQGREVKLLTSNGEVHVNVNVKTEGNYVVCVTAFADQAGDEPAKMAIRADGICVKRFEVRATSDAPDTYSAQLRLPAGKHRIAAAFTNDYYRPDSPDPNDRDRNLYVAEIEWIGPLDATEREKTSRILPLDPVSDERGAQVRAARDIIRPLASRVYRRPASDEQVDRLTKLAETAIDAGDSFERAMQVALTGMLASPHFLYREEPQPEPDKANRVEPIDEFALATRLSYFLWSSTPDDELLGQAEKRTLRENLDSQVKRMLADPKSAALGDNFAMQWLELRRLSEAAPDAKLFPDFDEELRAAMRRESELFFAAVVRDDRPLVEFLDADYTFLNDRLARHYGIPGVKGNEFRRVKLENSSRGGLLTQASVLTVTSNPTRTSPVKRGKWVLDVLLGDAPPPPPPDVPELKEEANADDEGTLRERLLAHRSNPNCAVCHTRMDPLGFALENYDAIGAWRTHEGKTAIDAAGELPGGERFSGAEELKKMLVGRTDQFRRALAEKLLTYALGRGVEKYDRRSVDKIVREILDGGDRFSGLVLAVVRSDPFQMRRGDGGKP